MSVRTDYINLNVNVNGDAAKNELNQLKKRSAELNAELKTLHGNSKRAKEIKKEIEGIDTKMAGLRKQIGLTALSQKELTAELKRLQQLKNIATPQTKEFKELQHQIDMVSKRLKDVRNGTFGFKSMWNGIGKNVKEFAMLSASYLGFEFITGQVQSIINGAGKVSDKLADLQRVAGLSSKEVKNLYKELRSIDTRTGNSDLLNLAITASKLGIAKDDVADFTKALDQLQVALGDELGDADKVAEEIGKIINVYDKGAKITGERARQIGNAVVTLANQGVASGAYNVSFTQRLAGIANAANIALGPVMGLAAGFEELGQSEEVASTAVTQIIGKIGADVPKYAKLAGVSVKEFSRTLRNDPVEALIKLAEGLVKSKSGFAEIAVAFKDAEASGTRVTATLASLGAKADFFRNKINIATDALENTTQITDAYRLKNENLGAVMDKVGKKVGAAFTSGEIVDGLTGIIKKFGEWIGAIDRIEEKHKILEAQRAIVNKLEKDISPLIDMYDYLTDKANNLGGASHLSAEEQQLLAESIAKVSEAIPGAISQTDAYGKAIGINVQHAREFIKLQRLLLQEKNRDAIEETKNTIAEQERKLKDFESAVKTMHIVIQQYVSDAEYGLANRVDTQMQKMQLRIAETKERLMGLRALLNELSGKPLTGEENNTLEIPLPKGMSESRYKELLKSGGKSKAAIKDNTPTLTEEEQKAADKEAKRKLKKEEKAENEKMQRHKKYMAAMQRLRDDMELAAADNDQKELLRITNKYRDLYDLAWGNAQDMAMLNKQEKEEFAKLWNDYYKKQREKQDEERLKNFEQQSQAAANELEQTISNKVLISERGILESERGTIAELDAHKAYLKARFDAETLFLDKNSELYKTKQAELNADMLDADRAFIQQRINEAEQLANTLGSFMQAYFDILNQRDQQALRREEERNNSRKESYKQMLDNNLINQEDYNNQIAALDAGLERSKKEAAKREAKRQKAMATFQAIISTAAAVANALNTQPAWLGIALAAVVGATGVAQVVKIQEQEEPAIGRKGLVLRGASHEDQGIDMYERKSGKRIANVEGGEPVLVMSRQLYGNNREVIDELMYNSMYNNGARIKAPWYSEKPAQINTPRIIPLLRNGGTVAGTGMAQAPGSTAAAAPASNAYSEEMVSQLRNINEVLQNWPTVLQAYVSLRDLKEQEDLLQMAKDTAGINQQKAA